jgi:hypothetical protein
MVYFDKVEKATKPELVPPKGKDEHPLTRGHRVHESAELFVRGECELIPELNKFAENFVVLRDFFSRERYRVIMEERWAFNRNWEACGWSSENAWVRMLVDFLVIDIELGEAIIIDYKTGRKHGNEVKHATQGQLYQLAVFLRYPELENITVEFWYTDQNAITRTNYKRSFGMQFKELFTNFGNAVTNEIHFRPRSTPYTCKWCNFGRTSGTGHCPHDYYLGAKNA